MLAECLCPNCKASSDLIEVEQVEYINCPDCGWFEVQADGGCTTCDPPQSTVDPEPEPETKKQVPPQTADLKPGGDHQQDAPSPEPPGKPLNMTEFGDDVGDGDNGDEVTIKINFED